LYKFERIFPKKTKDKIVKSFAGDDQEDQDSLEWNPESHDQAPPADGARPPRMVEFSSSIEVPGDKTQYTCAKLPEIVGTGYPYTVEVTVIVTTARENEVTSNPVSGIFVTRPLAPTNLRPDKEKSRSIVWYKSMTPYVRRYRVRSVFKFYVFLML
jgi:hypothetical protein